MANFFEKVIKCRNRCAIFYSARRSVVSTYNRYKDFDAFTDEELESHSEDGRAGYDQLYPSHIPTTLLQKAMLTVGSAALAITNPQRGDMVATLGETTGYFALQQMKKTMKADVIGRQILKEKPVINTSTVNLASLRALPDGTFGKVYSTWLDVNRASPDERLPVQFVDDVELSYVMRRYREIHDLVHAVLGMPTNMLGEVTVKVFEGIQTGLPMCISGGLFGPVRLGRQHLELYLRTHLPWAVRNAFRSRNMMNVYFEKRWEQPVTDFRRELNLEDPPDTPQRKTFK